MAPTRRSISSAGNSPAADDILGLGRLSNYSEVTKNLERLKTQRAEAQKKIASDYQKRLAILKSRIENDHREKREIMSQFKSAKLQHLFNALNKKTDCERAIKQQIDTLAKDAGHLAMLIDAIYTARGESLEDAQSR